MSNENAVHFVTHLFFPNSQSLFCCASETAVLWRAILQFMPQRY